MHFFGIGHSKALDIVFPPSDIEGDDHEHSNFKNLDSDFLHVPTTSLPRGVSVDSWETTRMIDEEEYSRKAEQQEMERRKQDRGERQRLKKERADMSDYTGINRRESLTLVIPNYDDNDDNAAAAAAGAVADAKSKRRNNSIIGVLKRRFSSASVVGREKKEEEDPAAPRRASFPIILSRLRRSVTGDKSEHPVSPAPGNGNDAPTSKKSFDGSAPSKKEKSSKGWFLAKKIRHSIAKMMIKSQNAAAAPRDAAPNGLNIVGPEKIETTTDAVEVPSSSEAAAHKPTAAPADPEITEAQVDGPPQKVSAGGASGASKTDGKNPNSPLCLAVVPRSSHISFASNTAVAGPSPVADSSSLGGPVDAELHNDNAGHAAAGPESKPAPSHVHRIYVQQIYLDTLRYNDVTKNSGWASAEMREAGAKRKKFIRTSKKSNSDGALLKIKKYGVLDETIGKGTCSTVRIAHKFAAKKKNGEQLFAVKTFVRCHMYENENGYAKRLASEFCISSTMDHVNIVRTLDLMKDETERWFEIQEYCPGGDMHMLLLNHGPLEASEADCFFKQLANGVAYLHLLGVAHMDLKPENLLLDASGCLKITDFGSSEVFRTIWETDVRYSAASVSGACCHPMMEYLAPEEFTEKSYDPRAVDVWSMGIIYIYMINKSLPWRTATVQDNAYAHYRARYIPREPRRIPESKLGTTVEDDSPTATMLLSDRPSPLTSAATLTASFSSSATAVSIPTTCHGQAATNGTKNQRAADRHFDGHHDPRRNHKSATDLFSRSHGDCGGHKIVLSPVPSPSLLPTEASTDAVPALPADVVGSVTDEPAREEEGENRPAPTPPSAEKKAPPAPQLRPAAIVPPRRANSHPVTAAERGPGCDMIASMPPGPRSAIVGILDPVPSTRLTIEEVLGTSWMSGIRECHAPKAVPVLPVGRK